MHAFPNLFKVTDMYFGCRLDIVLTQIKFARYWFGNTFNTTLCGNPLSCSFG